MKGRIPRGVSPTSLATPGAHQPLKHPHSVLRGDRNGKKQIVSAAFGLDMQKSQQIRTMSGVSVWRSVPKKAAKEQPE